MIPGVRESRNGMRILREILDDLPQDEEHG
jgi:hypothetical protein